MKEGGKKMSSGEAERSYSQASFSRRRFLQLGVAAGAATLLAACGAPAAEQKTGATAALGGQPAAKPEAGTPKRGGVLKIAFPGSPKLLDPAITVAAEEYMITQAIYNNLVRLDAKLTPQPELASDWKASEDGKTWTFNLRKGVMFHHGREFNSKDVDFTIKRVLDPKTASQGRSSLEIIKEIQTPDPYTVKFILDAPFGDLPMLLGSTFGRIVPFDASTDLQTKPSGTGPFKMKEFVAGDRTVLVRNTEYWEKDANGNQLPYVDELRQQNIPEQAAQIAALSGGTVDILFEASAQSIPVLKSDANVNVVEVASPAYHSIVPVVTKKPFNDVRVRQALKYCIDRDQAIKAALGGFGVPSNDSNVPPISPFKMDTGIRKRDIEKAKALMAEAGYSSGIDVELLANNERIGNPELAVTVKEMAAPAGFRITVKTLPSDVFNAEYTKHDFVVLNWNGKGTIDETLYQYYRTKGSLNWCGYSNADVDKLLETGRRESDMQKRKDAYGQIQKILVDDGPDVIAYFRSYVTGTHKRVQGFTIHPMRWVDVRSVWLG